MPADCSLRGHDAKKTVTDYQTVANLSKLSVEQKGTKRPLF